MSLIGQIRGTVEDIVREVLADIVGRLDDLEARLKALEDQLPDPGKKAAPVANATRAKAATATAKGSGS